GGTKTRKIDTRIIAATHKNLEKLVEIGEFREDLYYRLNVIPIIASPLRSHPEDIPILINYFLNYFAQELKLPRKIFNPETIQEIQSWEFKGNVRELKNFIERVYILIEQEQIGIPDIQNLSLNSKETDFWNQTLFFKDKKREFEKKYLQTQLRLYGGNISKTAEVLGLQISNLSRKLKELNIK
ncbi:MAG: sigma-54-dependent Fis family transcriptional regulator, partial [Candidatus Cloacimonetes bacterium]|nr:sigma-54-dependent Fis family transcriptional regulator [Candidatus Cloacimonadota bacterium]